MKSQSGAFNSREVRLYPGTLSPAEHLHRIRLVPDRMVKTQLFRVNIEREALKVLGDESAFFGYIGRGKAGPSL